MTIKSDGEAPQQYRVNFRSDDGEWLTTQKFETWDSVLIALQKSYFGDEPEDLRGYKVEITLLKGELSLEEMQFEAGKNQTENRGEMLARLRKEGKI